MLRHTAKPQTQPRDSKAWTSSAVQLFTINLALYPGGDIRCCFMGLTSSGQASQALVLDTQEGQDLGVVGISLYVQWRMKAQRAGRCALRLSLCCGHL